MTTAGARYPVPESAGELARRTAFGIGVAVVAVLVAQVVVDALGLEVGAGAVTS